MAMDVTALFQEVSSDVLLKLAQSAVIVNFCVLGSKIFIQGLMKGVSSSVIPITFTDDQMENMTIVNLIAAFVFATLQVLLKCDAGMVWWKVGINILFLTMASMVFWKYGIKQTIDLVVNFLEFINKKIKGE